MSSFFFHTLCYNYTEFVVQGFVMYFCFVSTSFVLTDAKESEVILNAFEGTSQESVH